MRAYSKPDANGKLKVRSPVAPSAGVATAASCCKPAERLLPPPQVYTHEHEVVEFELSKLAHRFSLSGQCVCTYTAENQACSCAAKAVISEQDRRGAADELRRRSAIVSGLPEGLAEEGCDWTFQTAKEHQAAVSRKEAACHAGERGRERAASRKSTRLA